MLADRESSDCDFSYSDESEGGRGGFFNSISSLSSDGSPNQVSLSDGGDGDGGGSNSSTSNNNDIIFSSPGGNGLNSSFSNYDIWDGSPKKKLFSSPVREGIDDNFVDGGIYFFIIEYYVFYLENQ